MSNLDKNIVITPNVGSATDDPKIVFSGANTTSNAQNITMRAYPTANGTLSVEGSAGQLFSITNQLTGTIFSVNDISGIPSIDVQDTGQIRLAPFNGYVSVSNNFTFTGNTFNMSSSNGINIAANTGVNSVVTVNNGTGYTSFPTVTVSPPQTVGGTTANVSVLNMYFNTATIASGGTGYNVGDVLTIVGGTTYAGDANATVIVSSNSGGVITAVTRTNNARYTVFPTNPVTTTGPTGSANNATLNLNFWAPAFTINNAGSGYTEQPQLTFSGGGGSAAAAYAAVGTTSNVKFLGSALTITGPGGGIAARFYDAGGASGTGGAYWNFPSNFSGTNALMTSTAIGQISSGGTNYLSFMTNATAQEQFRVTHTASAVNYINITGSATGPSYVQGPTISALGSDADIPIYITTKGSGAFRFNSPTGAFSFVSGSSGTGGFTNMTVGTSQVLGNYFSISGAQPTGNGPFIQPNGVDANIDARFASLGAGFIKFFTGNLNGGSGREQLRIGELASGGNAAINFVQISGNTTSNAVTISAQGNDPTVSLSLLPKANAAILLNQRYNQGTGAVQILGNTAIAGSTTTQNLYVQGGSNFLYYSQDFTNATYWSKTNSSITIASTTAPDGTLTALKITANAATGPSVHNLTQLINLSATQSPNNSIWTISGYFKSAEVYKAQFAMSDAVLGSVAYLIDTSNGTISSPSIGSGWTNSSASVNYVANGWYRFAVTATKTTPGGFVLPIVNIYDATNTTGSFIGDGVSGMFVWGLQAEKSQIATPYVTTTSGPSISANNNIWVPNGNVYIGVSNSNPLLVGNTYSLTVAGGIASGNVYSSSVIGFANNTSSLVYQTYNSSTNSLDIVFG